MSALVIVDAEVRQKAQLLADNIKNMALVCDELANVLEMVTLPGGGLSSKQMQQAMEGRANESRVISTQLERLASSIEYETALYLTDIDTIDSALY